MGCKEEYKSNNVTIYKGDRNSINNKKKNIIEGKSSQVSTVQYWSNIYHLFRLMYTITTPAPDETNCHIKSKFSCPNLDGIVS